MHGLRIVRMPPKYANSNKNITFTKPIELFADRRKPIRFYRNTMSQQLT